MPEEMKTNALVKMCLKKANEAMAKSDFLAYGYWMSRAHDYEKEQARAEMGRNKREVL